MTIAPNFNNKRIISMNFFLYLFFSATFLISFAKSQSGDVKNRSKQTIYTVKFKLIKEDVKYTAIVKRIEPYKYSFSATIDNPNSGNNFVTNTSTGSTP